MIVSNPKIGFIFSTKDRIEFSQRSLESIDTETGFDLIWVDGSESQKGKEFPKQFRFKNCNLAEVHRGVTGGAGKAIVFGAKRLLELEYDYCGLIENDIRFKQGWLPKLMELFEFGHRDGIEVGAVTARTIASRVLSFKADYVTMWNVGAAMVLFTRRAMKIIFDNIYNSAGYGTRVGMIIDFWMGKVGVDIIGREPCVRRTTARHCLGHDWSYAMELYKHNLFSLGSIPSMAFNMDCDIPRKYNTYYVEKGEI